MVADVSKYKIKSKVVVWAHEAGAWHFVAVDKVTSATIKERYGISRRGFGSIPVSVTLGKTAWKTSIFPDAKSGTYLLPLNAKVRKSEEVMADDEVTFTIEVRNSY